MHNNFIKHFIVVLIIFSNQSFGKEFNELFTIYVPIENSSKIESSINSSFNNLIFRISGSNSPSNIWRIINSGSARKDFITSYSIKNYENISFLEVIFNQDKVISKFKELSIPIIGHSRPVIFFLIEIESGSETSYFVSEEPENSIDTIFINSLQRLSEQRGIFLELPIFDLEDQKTISNSDILFSPKNYLTSKYNFDKLVDIKLINIGLNEWLFSGDIEKSISNVKYKKDIESIFFDYKISKDKLLTLIGVTDLDILSFKNNIIKYQANIMGDINSLSRDIDNNSFFEIDGYMSSEILNLIYKK